MYNKKKTLIVITVILLIISSFSHKVSTVYANQEDQDIANRILCRFEDGRTLVNLRSTDYFHYKFRSKSAMASLDKVNSSWLNKLLTVAGFDFNEVNFSVLGRELNPSSITTGVSVNEGARVNVFDRFGMSGLKWSSYQGEWKYNHVDACYSGHVSPTTYGTYYVDRKEPKSTHNEISTSKDPRVIQFNKGVFSLIGTGFIDLIANGIFSIAKLLVTLTIVFVGFSFTDITSLMGLTSSGGGGKMSVEIFNSLYEIIFRGFIIFAVLFTAIYIIYNGLIKRQFRLAISSLLKTITIFIIATIMSLNPSFWIGVPNKLATYGQAIVLSTMAGVYDSNGAPALCETDVGSIGENAEFTSNYDETYLTAQMEKVNSNMRSLIGCQMWEVFLFRPWVRGQFGVEYEDLDISKLGNTNADWVGDASVPVGNGEIINNWGLFHLSTQTDAHSQIGDNNFRTVVNGINADWWRIVDALSNYNEGEVTESLSNNLGSYQETFVEQNSFDTTDYWQTWIGNNSMHRIGTAFMAIAFAILGSLPSLIFSFSSAMYGFGITLLMMMSPLFLLLGTWSGKGDSIFLGWLSALGNMILKRIGVSILLILSLTITMNVMNLVYTIGFIKSFILMVIVSIILIKNRRKLLEMFATLNLGGSFNPLTKAQELLNKNKNAAKKTGKIGLAAIGGASMGLKTGQNVVSSARSAAANQIMNTLYQSTMGMSIARELEINLEKDSVHNCAMCYKTIGTNDTQEIAYRDDHGNYFCINCAEELGIENLYETVVGGGSKTSSNVRKISKKKIHKCSSCKQNIGEYGLETAYKNEKNQYVCAKCMQDNSDFKPIILGEDIDKKYYSNKQIRTVSSNSNRSYLSHRELKEAMEFKLSNDTHKHYWNDSQVEEMINNNLKNLIIDISVMKNLEANFGKRRRPPATPEPLHQYIDTALLNLHWTNGNYNAVENTYKEAWKQWYEDNGQYIKTVDDDSIKKFKTNIDNHSLDPTERLSVEGIIKADVIKALANQGISIKESEKLYMYENGKLNLIN